MTQHIGILVAITGKIQQLNRAPATVGAAPGRDTRRVVLMQSQRITTGTRTFDRAAWLASARARNHAFIDELNARTICAHCGAQPIEWHNPEHVKLNRQGFRISSLVGAGISINLIEKELERCTPLCRRCHMEEDGRLPVFVAAGPRSTQPPKPCGECGQPYKPLRRGLCRPCYRARPEEKAQAHRAYLRRNGQAA